MANGKTTIAQQAVKLFMAGTVAEAKQILEIGLAIVEQREAAGAGQLAAVTQRRKPGPRPQALPPATPVQASNVALPDPAAPVRRRPGRPAGSGKTSGPVGVVPPAASASDVATAPVTRRRGRPPVVAEVPAAAVEAPVGQATPAEQALQAGINELPPQGEPGED